MVRVRVHPYRRAMTLFSPRRTAMILATALAGVGATAAPALAAISDGTSNTIQVASAAAKIDPAQHRVVIDGTSSALSLNFTKVELLGHGGCTPGVDTCLIESDGLLPPIS